MTFEEMRDWIKFTQKRYVSEDVERQWQSHLDSDPQVSRDRKWNDHQILSALSLEWRRFLDSDRNKILKCKSLTQIVGLGAIE